MTRRTVIAVACCVALALAAGPSIAAPSAADEPSAQRALPPAAARALEAGTAWLVRTQNPDGSWTFDSTVTAARHELDETKRNLLYRRADSIAFRDAPMVFLYFYDELYAVQPWVKNFVPPVIFNGQRWTNVSIAAPKP